MLQRINARKSDLDALMNKAKELLGEEAENPIAVESLLQLNDRFQTLHNLVSQKHDYLMKLIEKWKRLMEKRRKVKGLFKSSPFLIQKRSIKSSVDARKHIHECQVSGIFS